MKNLQKITICLITILTIMFGFDNISEKKANETVIVSSQLPALTNSKANPTIEIFTSDAPYTNPGPSWTNNDIVIDSAYDYDYKISVATRRSNGDIYVAASRKMDNSSLFTIQIWHSSNGINWTPDFSIYSSSAHILNPSMNIFTADSEYLIVAFQTLDTTYDNADISSYRQAFGATSGIFGSISGNPGIWEMEPAICNSDLQFPSDPWLYCAFVSFDSIVFVRSVDYGKTWTSRQVIGTGGSTWDYARPDCAFGWHSSPDSMFIGVVWEMLGINGTRQIRFRKNTLNGTTGYWRPMQYFTPPSNRFDYYPALQMTHGNYPSAVITFVRKDTVGTPDNSDLYMFVTDDGAATWDTLAHYNSSFASNVPHSLGIDDALGYYHLVFRDQSGYVQYQKARYDSTSYSWSSYAHVSSGNSYSDNDFPAVGTRNSEPYVSWADWHSPVYKLKFDAEWLQTGIEERPDKISTTSSMSLAPNPARSAFKISYQIIKEGSVKISMFDVSGRIVGTLMDETKTPGAYSINIANLNLATGVYFIQLETPADITTAKMTIVR